MPYVGRSPFCIGFQPAPGVVHGRREAYGRLPGACLAGAVPFCSAARPGGQ